MRASDIDTDILLSILKEFVGKEEAEYVSYYTFYLKDDAILISYKYNRRVTEEWQPTTAQLHVRIEDYLTKLRKCKLSILLP